MLCSASEAQTHPAPRNAGCSSEQKRAAGQYCIATFFRSQRARSPEFEQTKVVENMVKKNGPSKSLRIRDNPRFGLGVHGANKHKAHHFSTTTRDNRIFELPWRGSPPQAESNAGVCRGGREVGPGLLSPADSRRLKFYSSRWLENKDNRAKQHGSWCYPWSSVSFPSPQPLPAPSRFCCCAGSSVSNRAAYLLS